MDLTKVFSAVSGGIIRKETKTESYLAVKVSSRGVAACVWTVSSGTVAVGKVGSGEGELLGAMDKAISIATEGLAEEVNRVVFALPYQWVVDGKVLPEKLTELRRLCKELDLSPLGYVSLTEALENYYKETEGAPLTAILVGIDGDETALTMYRAGKNLGTVLLELDEKNNDISPAVEKALKHFAEAEVLPSRIILYDGTSDLEAVAKKVTAYPWTQRAAFLHFPKVEVLGSEVVARAVAVAGGMQLGGHFDEENNKEEVRPKEQELVEVSAQEAGFVTEEGMSGVEVPVGMLSEIVREEPARAEVERKKMEFGKEFKNILTKFRQVKMPKLGLVAVAGAVIILGGLLAASYLLPTAEVSVSLATKPFDKQMDITIAPGSAASVEVTEVGTKKGVTTGSKLVGDKARGSVTIANPSDARNFAAGTVLTSSSGQKFVLVSDTQIASGSGVLAMSSVAAQIAAAEIGDTYNLPAGTLFSISGFVGQAKNDSAFSGGNSHQATVVTKADQDRLSATLSAELAAQANGDLQNKLESGQKLLPNAAVATVEKKKFSKDVDSEGDTVSLDLTMSFRGIVFSEDDVLAAFRNNYSGDIPRDYDLNKNNAKIEVKEARTDKAGNAILTFQVSADLRPKVDGGQIASKISGKSWAQASRQITKMTGVRGASLTVKPTIFSPLVNLFLPWRKGGINVRLY